MTDISGKIPDRHAPELASPGVDRSTLDRAPPDWAEIARPHADAGHHGPRLDRPMPSRGTYPAPLSPVRGGARFDAALASDPEADPPSGDLAPMTSVTAPSQPFTGAQPAGQQQFGYATPRAEGRQPAAARVNREGTSDVALSAAFALLSLTVGGVLYLVVELPLLVAALLTVSCLTGLLAAQLFARRTTSVAALHAEIAELKLELASLKGGTTGQRAGATGFGSTEAAPEARSAKPEKPARRWFRRAARPEPDDLGSIIAGVREAALTNTSAPAPVAGAETTVGSARAPLREAGTAKAEIAAVAEAGASTAHPMAALDRTEIPPPAAPTVAPEHAHRMPPDEPGMAPYWALRPGTHREPRVTVAAADAAALASGPLPLIETTSKGQYGRSAPARRFETTGPPARNGGSLADVPTAGASLDLDTMQNLIEQLAVQLHHPVDDGAATPAHGAAIAMQTPGLTPIAPPVGSSAMGAGVDAIRVQAGLSAAAGALAMTTASAAPTSVSAAAAPATTGLGVPAETPAPPQSGRHEAAPFGHLALIAEAVEANRMDVCLDPILGLADRKARHFELSVRLVTERGDDVGEDVYGDLAAGTGLLARIDAAKLSRAADVLERLRARGSRASLFSSVAGESLADDNFAGTFADILTAEEGLGARLVLTFAQAEARTFTQAHWRAISDMSAIGLKFALSDVVDLDMDFAALKAHGFDFIKLDAPVFLEGLPTPAGHIPAADICRHLAGLGLGVIVGGIVAEKDLAKVLGFGALLGQGTLFGGPRSVELERERRAA